MSLFTPAEGSLRPDEARNVIQRFENGEWVDIVVPKTTDQLVAECRACDGNGHIDGEKCEICDGTGYVPYLEPRSIFRMTPEERKAIMAANPPEITSIHYGGMYLDWSWMGCGFGQLSFEIDRATGAITFMDEHMGKERVRTILHQLVDHLVENGKFDER